MTAKVSRATRRPGRCNRFRLSLPIVASLSRFRPAFCGTLRPGAATVPVADAVIASVRNSATTTVPPTSGQRSAAAAPLSQPPLPDAAALTATWPAFMSTPAAVPSSGRAGAAPA